MTTATGTRMPSILVDLDPCGVPSLDDSQEPRQRRSGPLPGLESGTVMACVQGIEPPRPPVRLAWGTTHGRTILIAVDEASCTELAASIDAGEAPTTIVGPEQVVAIDLDPAR